MTHPLRASALVLATGLIGSTAVAQMTSHPVNGPIHHINYDFATGEITPGNSLAQAVSFANVTTVGSFGTQTTVTEEWVDWGIKTAGFDGMVTSIDVGYATTDPTGAAFTVNLYTGTIGDCVNNPGEPGTLVATLPLTGLPGSSVAPMAEGFVVTIDVSATPIPMPDGPIGWSYGATDLLAGPLLIMVGADPTGTVDAFDVYDPPGTCLGTAAFMTPGIASFYLALSEDDGTAGCAAPTTYGSADTSDQGNTAVIGTTGGDPSVTNPNFAITLTNANPNQGCFLIESAGMASTPTAWGTIWVASPFIRHPMATSATGTASFTPPMMPAMVGMTVYYEWVIRDPGMGSIAHHSEGLEVTYCP